MLRVLVLSMACTHCPQKGCRKLNLQSVTQSFRVQGQRQIRAVSTLGRNLTTSTACRFSLSIQPGRGPSLVCRSCGSRFLSVSAPQGLAQNLAPQCAQEPRVNTRDSCPLCTRRLTARPPLPGNEVVACPSHIYSRPRSPSFSPAKHALTARRQSHSHAIYRTPPRDRRIAAPCACVDRTGCRCDFQYR